MMQEVGYRSEISVRQQILENAVKNNPDLDSTRIKRLCETLIDPFGNEQLSRKIIGEVSLLEAEVILKMMELTVDNVRFSIEKHGNYSAPSPYLDRLVNTAHMLRQIK